MSMNKILTWLALAFVASASAQTVPYSPIVQGQVWTASQWNTAWGSKTDYPAPLSSLAAISAYTIPCNSSGSSAVPTACITLPSGFQLYVRTAAEIAAGVTPVNYGYAPGNVLRYGADPTANADSSTAVNNDIKAALASGGTGYIYVPGGTFLISGSQILFGNSLAIVGFNRAASVFWCNLPVGTSCFRYSNNGTSSPVVNTSGYGQISISGITITTAPGFSATGSTAAALELSCEGYSYMEVESVRLTGAFKYGLINDGCEVSHYTSDIIDNSGPANSINFWIVNGPDRVAGQGQGFSNLVTIENDQLNGGAYGIVDDGGSNHSIRDTNINGNATPIRIADAQAFGIDRDDMENAGIQTGIANIDFESTTLSGATTGESTGGTIEGNCFCADMAASGSGGKASLAFEGTGYSAGISISGNMFRFNLGPNADIDVTHLANSRVGPDNANGNASSTHYVGVHNDAYANILIPPQNGYPGAVGNSGLTCSMVSGTSCTTTVPFGYTHCAAYAQGATAYYAACSVSGTTATVTANASNSATWLVTATQ